MSFVRPRKLAIFDPRHVTRFSPIRKRIWVRRYHKMIWLWVCKFIFISRAGCTWLLCSQSQNVQIAPIRTCRYAMQPAPSAGRIHDWFGVSIELNGRQETCYFVLLGSTKLDKCVSDGSNNFIPVLSVWYRVEKQQAASLAWVLAKWRCHSCLCLFHQITIQTRAFVDHL